MAISKISRRTVLTSAGIVGAGAVAAAVVKLDKPGAVMMNGRSRARPIPSDTDFPKAVDVVVIGGGNIGAATALNLAERGVSVAVCEKGVIAGEASCRSFGLVENLGIDPTKIEMVGRSKELWPQMNARTGQETGYVRNGLMMMLANEGDRFGLEQWMAAVKGAPGIDARIIDRREVDTLVPGINAPHIGGIFQASDGQAEPQLAATAMALGARARGARIFQGCAVRGIDRTGGRISGVFTERGRIACQAVVLAGGAWTPLFLRSLGVDLPQLDAGSSSVSVTAPGIPKTPTILPPLGWRPMWNGRVTVGKFYVPTPIVPDTFRYLPKLLPIMGPAMQSSYPVFSLTTFLQRLTTPNHWAMDEPSPFEKIRVLVSDVAPSIWQDGLQSAADVFPAFKQAKVAETWGGFISSTIDNLPVIDRVAAVPGLVVASAFNYGLAMAPAAGEALADLVMNRELKVNLHNYRLNRFFDGTPIQFHD